MRRSVILGLGLAVATVLVHGTASGDINHPVPGIWGFVTATGACPARGTHCPPRGVSAQVNVEQHGEVVATQRSNTGGEFAFGLAPGRYTVAVAGGSKVLRCPTKQVTVPEGSNVRVDITCHLRIP